MSEQVKLNTKEGWISNKTKKTIYKHWKTTKEWGTVVFKWGWIPMIIFLGMNSKKKTISFIYLL